MIATLTDLARDDLGIYTVAVMFVGVAIGMAFLAIAMVWDRPQEPTVSRPTSSNRKSGRVRGGL